jgi:hypothetical protein
MCHVLLLAVLPLPCAAWSLLQLPSSSTTVATHCLLPLLLLLTPFALLRLPPCRQRDVPLPAAAGCLRNVAVNSLHNVAATEQQNSLHNVAATEQQINDSHIWLGTT